MKPRSFMDAVLLQVAMVLLICLNVAWALKPGQGGWWNWTASGACLASFIFGLVCSWKIDCLRAKSYQEMRELVERTLNERMKAERSWHE